jgi:murein DD-endopeptidase MepM/ murein hydrolase activator NlpD
MILKAASSQAPSSKFFSASNFLKKIFVKTEMAWSFGATKLVGSASNIIAIRMKLCEVSVLVVFAVLLLAVGLLNDAISAELPLRSSFDLQVSEKPRPVIVNGKPRLVYELHLTNFSLEALTLQSISVLDAASEVELITVRDDALNSRIGLPNAGSDKRTVQPGLRAVVYFEVEISGREIPDALKHRIEYEVPKTSEPGSVEGAQTSIQKDPLLILDPPLSGGPWAAIYEPSWERGHRRVFYAVEGEALLPGRFAIDWIKLDDEGRYANGSGDQINDWYGYGADVLAVADARVAATRDNVEESKIVKHERHKLEDANGNYVALDLGNGYFAFYEHLKPGSVRVKSGDKVQRGQVIASLGFTGDSTGPHLHFHVADRNSPLAAEGVPYLFKSFTVIGSYISMDEFGKKPWNPNHDSATSRRSSEFPAPKVVILF